ncbi:MAG: MauE/DoxX family redox-associated membrane protein, partial [Planctomycetota bacterium]
AASKKNTIVSWVLAVPIAGVFVAMGALPKLTGDPYSVALFNKVATASFVPEGMADVSRFAVGVTELAAAVLILIPKTRVYGAVLAVLAMLGALTAHFITPLGVGSDLTINEAQQVIGDVTIDENLPPLFFMALGLLVVSAVNIWWNRHDLPFASKN